MAQLEVTPTTSTFGLGLNKGVVVGDAQDFYSATLGLDLIYLYHIGKRFHLGATTGYAHYFGEEITDNTIGEADVEDAQFIPVAVSIRISPLPNLLGGGDIGYAVALNDGNEGGIYLSPRLTYMIRGKIPVFAGYRMILEDETIGTVLFGVGFLF